MKFGELMNLFNKSIKIKVTRTHALATIPKKNHTNRFADAAYDLFAFDTTLPNKSTISIVKALSTGNSSKQDEIFNQVLSIPAGGRVLVGTGIRLAIPEGYWIKFHERSGLANKGIHILGGVIDSGYTGELKVIMYNSGQDTYEHECIKAIAQFTVERLTESVLEVVSLDDMEALSSDRERKLKGFGSSDAR